MIGLIYEHGRFTAADTRRRGARARRLRGRTRRLRRHQGAGARLLRARRRAHADAREPALDRRQLRAQLARSCACSASAHVGLALSTSAVALANCGILLLPAAAPHRAARRRARRRARAHRRRHRAHAGGRRWPWTRPLAGWLPAAAGRAYALARGDRRPVGRGGVLGGVPRPRRCRCRAPRGAARRRLRPAARRSAASSAGVDARATPPARSVAERDRPERARASSLSTGRPSAAHRRRTTCLRPSRSADLEPGLVRQLSQQAHAASATTSPSSRRTPRRRRPSVAAVRRAVRPSPGTRARRRDADAAARAPSAPSLVSSSRPLLCRSSRPTG